MSDFEYDKVHHHIWNLCQMLCCPFVMVLVLYRFFFGVWNMNKYYFPETLASHSEVFRFYTLKNTPVDKQEEDKRRERYKHLPELKNDIVDYIYFLYMSTGVVYYYYDIFDKVFFVGFANFNFCNIAFVGHHTLTILNYKFYGSCYYYTWYLMLPSAYHSVLVAFPSFYWNYHIYGISLALFTFSQLLFETMRSTRLHKWLIASVPILTPPIIMIAYGKCE